MISKECLCAKVVDTIARDVVYEDPENVGNSDLIESEDDSQDVWISLRSGFAREFHEYSKLPPKQAPERFAYEVVAYFYAVFVARVEEWARDLDTFIDPDSDDTVNSYKTVLPELRSVERQQLWRAAFLYASGE